jgi:hypothetical protein
VVNADPGYVLVEPELFLTRLGLFIYRRVSGANINSQLSSPGFSLHQKRCSEIPKKRGDSRNGANVKMKYESWSETNKMRPGSPMKGTKIGLFVPFEPIRAPHSVLPFRSVSHSIYSEKHRNTTFVKKQNNLS